MFALLLKSNYCQCQGWLIVKLNNFLGVRIFTDMEFVTSSTRVKYYWAQVKCLTLNAKKIAGFKLEFSQNSLSQFVFE